MSFEDLEFEFVESVTDSCGGFSSFVVEGIVAGEVCLLTSTVLSDAGSRIINGFFSRLSKKQKKIVFQNKNTLINKIIPFEFAV